MRTRPCDDSEQRCELRVARFSARLLTSEQQALRLLTVKEAMTKGVINALLEEDHEQSSRAASTVQS